MRTTLRCFLDNDQAGRKTVESISNVFEYTETLESTGWRQNSDMKHSRGRFPVKHFRREKNAGREILPMNHTEIPAAQSGIQ